jgi:hypothetical protein
VLNSVVAIKNIEIDRLAVTAKSSYLLILEQLKKRVRSLMQNYPTLLKVGMMMWLVMA